MRISRGREEDNLDIYNQSIKIWDDLRILIKKELNKNNLLGGDYGIIDPW